MKPSQRPESPIEELSVGDPDFNPNPPEAVPDTCPRCEAKLIDPAGLGWCKKCGYCKSLEEDKARAPIQTATAQEQPSFLGLREFFQVLSKFPSWVWVLLGGVATIIAANIPPSRSLAPDSMPRAIWSATEVIFGMFLILAAQVWALFVLAPEDDKLHFKDAILPGKLWGLTLKRLPETRMQVWFVAWGLAFILSAVTVLGGFSYWLRYLPKSAPPPAAVEESK